MNDFKIFRKMGHILLRIQLAVWCLVTGDLVQLQLYAPPLPGLVRQSRYLGVQKFRPLNSTLVTGHCGRGEAEFFLHP